MICIPRRFTFLLILALACTVGCGGGSDRFKAARPKTVPAEGDVMYKGSPLIGATLELIPTGTGTHGAVGMTDSSGHVVFKTFPPDSGVVPGDYEVRITLLEAVSVPVLPDGVHAEDVKQPKPKSLIPAKYADPKKSGEKATIPGEGRTDMKFELTD